MGDKRSGFSGAVADAIDQADPLLDEVETLDLFDGDPDAGSPVGASSFAQGKGGGVVQRKKPGRPKGAKNVSTQQMIDFINSRYRHPLLGLADIAATRPEDIAQLILPRDEEGRVLRRWVGSLGDGSLEPYQISKDDMKWALDFWKQCTMELAEYLTPKQPRDLVSPEGLPPIIHLNLGAQIAPGVASAGVALGFPKNPVNTGYEDADYSEVPRDEVPQTPQPAASTADQERSDD